MTLKVISGIEIKAGESLSSVADCSEGTLVRITMSEAWTPANLTCQISTDGELFNNLVSRNGEELTMPVVPGSAVVVAQLGDALKAAAFIKFRSGTSTHPVEQEERRELAVTIDVPDA